MGKDLCFTETGVAVKREFPFWKKVGACGDWGENEKYRNEWQEDGRLIPFFRIKALPHPEIEWGRTYALQRQEWL